MAAFDPRHTERAGDGIVGELSGDELAGIVVHRLFPKSLAESLRDTAVDLAIDDQRVDDAPAIVDAKVALDFDLAGFAIDFGDHDVRTEREREVRRFPEVSRNE